MAYDRNEVQAYITEAARRRGIDPATALRVIKQESGFNPEAQNLSPKEKSYGLMQLNTQGGLGVHALEKGINIRDPNTWRQQVDFGLDVVAKDGWRQWYGARDTGVGRWDGIGGRPAAWASKGGAGGGGGSPLVDAVASRGQGSETVMGDAGGDTLGTSSPSAPSVDVSIPPEQKARAELLKAVAANGMRQGSNAKNGWDVLGGLAQVWAASSEQKKLEGAENGSLQGALAGLDPEYRLAGQLLGDREGAAKAVLAQQENRATAANRAEDRAWRQDERTYQRGQDEKANARADATLQIAQDRAAGKGAEGAKTSLSPVYGTDEAGNAVLLQPRDDGTVVQSKLPNGVKVSTGVEKIDAGTHWVLQDKRSGQTVGTIPKENFEEARDTARGTVVGKTEGERGLSASGDAQSAQNALDLIKNIRDDPYRERGTGASSFMNRIPGTGGFDFEQKVEQAKSGAFLTAIQQMKGLGALSNTEGQAATAAITRMNTAASEEGFLEALGDYEKIVNQALDRAQANMPKAATPAPAAPPVPPKGPMQLPGPSVDDLVKKYGG